MWSKPLLGLQAAAVAVAAINIPNLDFDQQTIDSGLALQAISSYALLKATTHFSGSCTPDKLKIRQEWRTLSKPQRRQYIAAVQCIQAKPSLLPPGLVPAAQSVFDDFVYVHYNLTPFTHGTGNFLSWHRYYMHTYETHLRSCGYTGALPYWSWPLDLDSVASSPLFDGSDTSIGSDGAPVPHEGMKLDWPGSTPSGDPFVYVSPGSGGGCIRSGPFANSTINFGQVSLPIYGQPHTLSSPDPTAANQSRCIKRDLNEEPGRKWSTFRNITELILQNKNIEWFQGVMQGMTQYTGGRASLGVHGAGHYMIGGDPGSDPWITPGDPGFYFHHAGVDRVWWLWQMMDLEGGRREVFGTNTAMNNPPSEDTTVEDWLDMGPLAEKVRIKEVMNSVGGELCYVYV
ncbi:tyrosinase central domain protein [Cercophora samala]|uniref:Tyrosinase central domain protein n=1 Tax=Cercophora samala TaxID=330535 RepID=A0AA40D5H7_9PEZI|nr:tyrosinase central domain protein [Cercophora samala]